ncbi:hypothetical protein [Fontivita pretiosa]|uniref:hypothetical protein n=1 Tax=Fontivita pretiosa TaxID=2989684 RepID=UPI003D1677D7
MNKPVVVRLWMNRPGMLLIVAEMLPAGSVEAVTSPQNGSAARARVVPPGPVVPVGVSGGASGVPKTLPPASTRAVALLPVTVMSMSRLPVELKLVFVQFPV